MVAVIESELPPACRWATAQLRSVFADVRADDSEIVMTFADASNSLDPWTGEARGGEIGFEHHRWRSPRLRPPRLVRHLPSGRRCSPLRSALRAGIP